MNNCDLCGKEIEDKYDICYDCHLKASKENWKTWRTRKEKKEKIKEGEVDFSKKIELPLWQIIGVFILGMVIGAWIF